MPVNRNALIRYITIDKCLQNHYRKWTLDDLIDACSDALYEFEGIDKGVSKRTVQADIQVMRSEKLGYNAPIIVKENKYYTYEDPDYSITNIPLTDQDLEKLEEAVDILRQFKGFSHFKELSGIVQKLEDKVYSQRMHLQPVIDFEKNEDLRGLEYLDIFYLSIRKKQVLELLYKSFRAKSEQIIIFHPYLLKEYRNRWFILGHSNLQEPLMTLAIDRVYDAKIRHTEDFIEDKNFNPALYYKDVIGVTVNNADIETIQLFIDKEYAPYVITKPFHSSQKIIRKDNNGLEITIEVIPNFELQREILSYGEGIKVIAPEKLKKKIEEKLKMASGKYPPARN